MVGVCVLAAPSIEVGAQAPRIVPPPACRLPDRFSAPFLTVEPTATKAPSLAVLPFTQGIVERRYAHVPVYMANRVRTSLAASRDLAVVSEGTTARVVWERGNVADSVARFVGARWTLSGDVEPLGRDTRIKVRLLETPSTALWEGAFLLSRYSMADVERAIVDATRLALRLRQMPGAPGAVTVRREFEHTFAAAEVTLRGHTPAAADSARAMLETVFSRDTSVDVALALARATIVSLERSGVVGTTASAAGLRRVDALLDYVLKRDSTSARAWTVRAVAARYRDPEAFVGADVAHKRAVRLDPNSAWAEHEYGVTLTWLGEWREAERHFRRALSLEAGRPETLLALAEAAYQGGNAALTCGLTNASIASDPYNPRAYGLRALARLRLGQARESFSDAETAMQLQDNPATRGLRLEVEAAAANVDNARSLGRDYARRFLSSAGTMRVDEAVALGRAFTALGFKREAFGALSRARPVGKRFTTALSSAAFDPLRSDPTFVRLVRPMPPTRGRQL